MTHLAYRLNNCLNTSFIAGLSWVTCGIVSVCAGGGAGGAAASGEAADGGGILRPWLRPLWPDPPRPCCSRLPKVSPSLPPSGSDDPAALPLLEPLPPSNPPRL